MIGQRKIEQEVRLREGEANLLGGMLEDSQTKSLTGIPGLGQIPILKYLFGQTNTQHSQTETVFVLIPHIVRGQVLTELNERGIDVGTANAIELRRVSHSPATTGGFDTSEQFIDIRRASSQIGSARRLKVALRLPPVLVQGVLDSILLLSRNVRGRHSR